MERPSLRTPEQIAADEKIERCSVVREDPLDAAELDLLAAADHWVDVRRAQGLSAAETDLVALWGRLWRDA